MIRTRTRTGKEREEGLERGRRGGGRPDGACGGGATGDERGTMEGKIEGVKRGEAARGVETEDAVFGVGKDQGLKRLGAGKETEGGGPWLAPWYPRDRMALDCNAADPAGDATSRGAVGEVRCVWVTCRYCMR